MRAGVAACGFASGVRASLSDRVRLSSLEMAMPTGAMSLEAMPQRTARRRKKSGRGINFLGEKHCVANAGLVPDVDVKHAGDRQRQSYYDRVQDQIHGPRGNTVENENYETGLACPIAGQDQFSRQVAARLDNLDNASRLHVSAHVNEKRAEANINKGKAPGGA
ncbi:hypothetical protein Q1M64_27510 [Sinorhizobium meliloti]|nr:hypothetical protein Q1M64_27510 [Sinorhizobium meliloti]